MAGADRSVELVLHLHLCARLLIIFNLILRLVHVGHLIGVRCVFAILVVAYPNESRESQGNAPLSVHNANGCSVDRTERQIRAFDFPHLDRFKPVIGEASKEKPATENTETPEAAVKVFTPAARGGRKEKRTGADKQPAGSAHETAEEAIKAAQFRASEERRIRNKVGLTYYPPRHFTNPLDVYRIDHRLPFTSPKPEFVHQMSCPKVQAAKMARMERLPWWRRRLRRGTNAPIGATNPNRRR